jgi:Salmonella virulence plasmid 65kDa B protein
MLEKYLFHLVGFGCTTCLTEGTPVLLANGTARRVGPPLAVDVTAMRHKLRIGARLSPARLLTLAVLAVALVLSSCTSVLPATESSTRREAAAVEPPPGGLVDSAPNFGWTQGEFSVSGDGAAQYTVPLWVPAGRGAVTPQLSLSYSSRAGNGLLGVGWSLGGLSAISWCGRTIAQDGYTDGGHFDGQGALCLNGNRLVPISPPYSPLREYRTERETFTRIVAYETQDNVPNFFKVFTKDGKILTYGGSSDALVQPYLLTAGSNMAEPSLVRAPGAPRATTAWALNRIEDRNGNAATVEYTRTEGDAAGLWWMQLRPSQISYAPNRSVRFIYDEIRPDKIDGFVGGYAHPHRWADDPDRDAGRPGRQPRGAVAPIQNQLSDQ